MDAPSRQDVERQLRLVLAAPEFETAPKLSELLYHLVTETLAGNGDRLKGYAIGLDVFGREPGFDQGGDAIVRVQMGRLRKLLDEYYRASGAHDPIRILLARGRYAPRFELASGEAIEGVDSVIAPANAVTPTSSAAATAPPARRRWTLIGMAAGLVLLLAIIVALLTVPQWRDSAAIRGKATSQPHGPLIYVAQYEVIGDDPAGKRFAEGLQFDMVEQLSKFPDLNVVGIDTARGVKASAASTNPQGADFVLGGIVEIAGTMVRVTTQLSRTQDNIIIWSDQSVAENAEATTMLKLQTSIATNVAVELGEPYGVVPQAMTERLGQNAPPDQAQYACILTAYDYMRFKIATKHLKARTCLEATVAASPSNAQAWALLAWISGDEERYGFNRKSSNDSIRRALRAAERAVAADSRNAIAYEHLADARFLAADDAGAREAMETALRLNPNSSEVLADASWIYTLLDGDERARQMGLKAIALSPGHPAWYWTGPTIHALQNGLKADALKYARLNVSDRGPMDIYLLAAALRLNGQGKAADAELAALRQAHPETGDRARMMQVLRFPPQFEALIFGDNRTSLSPTR